MSAPLAFVVICPTCGLVLDSIDVEDGSPWGEATAWGYLASRAHRCPGGTDHGNQVGPRPHVI